MSARVERESPPSVPVQLRRGSEGQALGSEVQQYHPAQPWPLIGGLHHLSSSDDRRVCHGSTARVWGIRIKANIHTLGGHINTVASVICQVADPQDMTGSHDSTVHLWDLTAGKTMGTLTNHKKSVRSIVLTGGNDFNP